MLYRVYIYQHCHIIRIFLYLTPSPPHLFRTAIHPEYNIQSRIVYTAPVNRNIAVNGWREKGIARTHVWRVLFAMRKTSWCGCGDAVLAVYVRESFVERQHRVSHRKKFITNLRASIYESAFYEGERNVGGPVLYGTSKICQLRELLWGSCLKYDYITDALCALNEIFLFKNSVIIMCV